jgi:hypothetical protein
LDLKCGVSVCRCAFSWDARCGRVPYFFELIHFTPLFLRDP